MSITGNLDETTRRRRYAFGAAVRRHRTAAGLTQPALAELAGTDRQWVSHVENAGYSPSLDRVWALADALGIRPSELFASAEDALTRRPGDVP